jgi:hypothetical protein
LSISYADVFPILMNAVSNFEATDDDLIEPTPYFFLAEMTDFVCLRASSGAVEEIGQFAALLEQLALEGDKDVQDLLLDSLEVLQQCGCKDIVADRFGPKTQQLWASLSG